MKDRFPSDSSVFYDGGKYVLRSLERYSNEKIPVEWIDYRPAFADKSPLADSFNACFNGRSPYKACIDNVLGEAFDSGDRGLTPIAELEITYGFQGASEIEACQFATEVARIVAIHGSRVSSDGMNYGCPGGYAGERIESMEDLFLLALFEVYTRLILEEAGNTE